MRRIDTVDASKASWDRVAAYILTVSHLRDQRPLFSYLLVAPDLFEATEKLIRHMNCDDCVTVLSKRADFPADAPHPKSLTTARIPGPVWMATGAVLAALGMRTVCR